MSGAETHEEDGARRIINTYDQLRAYGGDRIAICYLRQDLGRGGHGANWHVVRLVDGKAMVTDSNAAWYERKNKTFWIMGRVVENRKPTLEKAIEWACERYGKREFVRNKMGDYVERVVQERFPIGSRGWG